MAKEYFYKMELLKLNKYVKVKTQIGFKIKSTHI